MTRFGSRLAFTLLLALGCAGTPADPRPAPLPPDWTSGRADYFIQMADTQLGMWSSPLLFAYLGWWGWNADSFARETRNMERAVGHANRLRPAFVVVCGDLINDPGHPGQTAEFQRIAGQLDPAVPLYLVAGNHDVENEPTPESLAWYRETFGPDRYSFQHGEAFGIVLNSQLIHSPEEPPAEAEAQLAWLREALAAAKASGAAHVLVFQHHPYFVEVPDEEDQYFNIPEERRAPYLALFREAGVRAVFAGHYHRNAHGFDGALEMVTTGPVGKPLGDDPSGLRIVRIGPEGLSHRYFSLGWVPERLGPAR